MLLILVNILILILGISLIVIADRKYWEWDYSDLLSGIGVILTSVASIGLVICLICLLTKPVHYKNFKVKYEVIANMQTSKDDIRDAIYTQKYIEINDEILTCREFINSKWLGIFENKKICDYELIKKGIGYEE